MAPHNKENMIQLACSRLVQEVCYTAKCPVQFPIWPIDNSKNKLLEVYLFYMVFGEPSLSPCNIPTYYNGGGREKVY